MEEEAARQKGRGQKYHKATEDCLDVGGGKDGGLVLPLVEVGEIIGLDAGEQPVLGRVSVFLQIEEGIGVTDEDLGLAQLECVPTEVVGLHDLIAALLRLSGIFGPCCRGQHLVAVQEALVLIAEAEAGALDPDVLEQAEVANLVKHELGVELARGFFVVGLDTADVVGGLGEQVGHQIIHRLLELEAGRGRALEVVPTSTFGEDLLQHKVLRGGLAVQEVLEEEVLVFVQEGGGLVGDLRGVGDIIRPKSRGGGGRRRRRGSKHLRRSASA